ncbi:MAG: adenylate kinase [Nitrospinae bacterium]|nr:adenylate kinase [Nitrospinota bacterium]
MRMVFLGAPGVGKGTQAELAALKFGVPKISTGDLLRAAVVQGTSLGREAKEYMDRGDLVPDQVVIGLVEEKVGAPECTKGFILDGFPRTVPQADRLSELLMAKGQSLDKVVCFLIPREEVVQRLGGRRGCSRCSAVYHVEFVPPKNDGVCDECGKELVQRDDDREETVRSRLSVYEEQTAPLIEYYREKNLLSELNGSGPVDTVQKRLVALLSGP